MEAEGIAPSAIGAFENTFNSLVSGNTGLIPESTISPAPDLVSSSSFASAQRSASAQRIFMHFGNNLKDR